MSLQKNCEDFLKTLYSTLEQRMMNYRREEHTFLQFFITLTVGVLGGMGIIEKFSSSSSAKSLALYLFFVIVGSGIWTIIKIIFAHKRYEKVGGTIVKIWERCGLFDIGIMDKGAKEYGKGKGYLISVSFVIVFMVIVGIFLLFIFLK